jgi:hypothetical protein
MAETVLFCWLTSGYFHEKSREEAILAVPIRNPTRQRGNCSNLFTRLVINQSRI